MPLKIFRRARLQKPVRAKPIVEPRTFSRRNFLKGAAALAAASIMSCRTAPLSEEQLAELQKRKEVRSRPPIITSLRTGNSVKQTLENTPNVRMLETNLRKYKTGEVREANLVRSFDWSNALPLDEKVRSIIHTHPTFNVENVIEQKMSQCPSAIDLLNILTKHQIRIPAKNLRFSHIAVISNEGKVIGYYSMMIGNKLEKNLQSRNIFPSREKVKLTKAMDELIRIMKLNYAGAPYASFLRLEKTIKTLQELGLRIRKTPMPGYTFKDGYFQMKK
ncbi:MAG: twin-arginine translocation signal domain-containing protein [Candidatus Diapherotrites archaeon]|uniref:Twin-arginine translocation signal domain-containing protein n=1 Tax=Candidatus Iainarchaeum sp. TaxID=3101447 RepID=A0A8T4CAT9_9ARCH|nr:twin-arginine translocation signal domain-containing protein [Candidatus Diapherotrites archaeon]